MRVGCSIGNVDGARGGNGNGFFSAVLLDGIDCFSECLVSVVVTLIRIETFCRLSTYSIRVFVLFIRNWRHLRLHST